MTHPETLRLHEEILLLALRDKEGTFAAGGRHRQALGGAVLAELLLARKIREQPTDRRKRVEVSDPRPLREPTLDAALERIRVARRPASLATWVGRFAGWSELPHRIAVGLCERGILRADERKVLLLFRRRIYPEVNPAPEKRLVDRLHRALLDREPDLEPRTLTLLCLAWPAGLLRYVADKRLLKQQRGLLQRYLKNEPAGRAVKEAIEAEDAAATAGLCTVMATA
jgi:hypothetical protein